MFDLEMIDELYDAAGGPPIFADAFNRDVRFPLRELPFHLERMTGEIIGPATVSEITERGWFPVYAGNDDEEEMGVPYFVPERLGLLLRLEREGWSHAELRAFAEFEDALIEDVLTTDELAYDKTDYEILTEQLRDKVETLRNTLRTIDEPGWRPESGGWIGTNDRDRTVRDLDHHERVLDHVRRFEHVTELPPDLKKAAYKLRLCYESTRMWMCGEERGKMEAGYSFFVQFEGMRNIGVGDFGEGIDWESTVRRPWLAEDQLPIRLPGIVLRGDTPELVGSPHPTRYQELWKQYGLDEYFRLRAEVADLKVCVHCLAQLPADADPTRKYCGERCRSAAKSGRHRMRNPSSVRDSQMKYWSSVADLRAKRKP